MGKRGRGRPGGPTVEVIEEFERLLGAGMPQDTVARVLGIGAETVRSWLKQAREGRGGPYQDFLRAITRARGRAEAGAIARVRSSDDWRAASWWLSHHPDTRDRWSDSGAVRKAETDLLAKVVGVLQTELPDAAQRHRVLTALVAAGCGALPETCDDPA